MAISFNTAAINAPGTQTTTQTLTIPAGVLAGDVMLLAVEAFFTSQFTPTVGSTGTAFTQIGTTQHGGSASGFVSSGAIFYAVAGAGDAGKVITVSGNNAFWALAVAAYTGASNVTPIDVNGGTADATATAFTLTFPAKTTGVASDWAVYLAPYGDAGGANITGPAGQASRENAQGSGVGVAIFDSNGSVGGSGASIGGIAYTYGSGGNSWLTAFTVGLAPAAPPGASSGSALPPLIPPHPVFTRALQEAAWARADWQAQGVADLSVSFASTSGGIDTYNVTSPWNGNSATQQMRVLKPTTANANYPHAFLIMLPVDTNQTTTFGDSIGTAQGISAHNTYNLTCVQPGYAGAGGSGTGPWFADNPLDPTISQEKYTLLVLDWIKRNLATSGTEKVYLIGFSRSGLAAQFLQFRHPYLFSAVASWDSPFGMTDYDGTDPNGAVGGNSADVFGTSASFQTNYALTAAHLGAWQATGQYGANRIWIGQGPAFADITGYDSALTTAGIPHTRTFSDTGESHAWHTDWVSAALAAIIPSNWAQAPTVLQLPQRLGHPQWTQLLAEMAVRRSSGTNAPHGTTPTSGAAWTITATVTAAAGVTRHRTASRPVTATITASAKVIRPRSASRPVTATITAAGTLAGFHQGTATRSETATITAGATATHLRGFTRAVTATITAGATKHPKHLVTATRPVTATITATATNEVRRRTAILAVTAQVTATAVNPTAPAAPVEKQGSWWQLLDILAFREQEFEFYADRPPVACPNDGEPLRLAPPTDSGSGVELYCPFDGWQYPRDWIRPMRL